MKKLLSIMILFSFLAIPLKALEFDASKIAFSHYGSYLSLMVKKSNQSSPPALYLWEFSGRRMWEWKGVYRFDPIYQGKVVDATYQATPAKFTMHTEYGDISFCFQDDKIMRIKGKGIGLKITQTVKDWSSISYPIRKDRKQWRFQMGGYDHYAYTALQGKSKGDPAKSVAGEAPPERPQMIMELLPAKNGEIEAVLEQYNTAWTPQKYTKSFSTCVKESQQHFENFMETLPPVPEEYAQLRQLGSYVKWSSVVLPKGNITQPVMYCSKNVMASVWPWDNCFSSMVAAYKNMDFAIDQMMLPFEHMNPKGALPNLVNAQHFLWGASQPPIQGLTMFKIMEYAKDSITVAQLERIYQPFAKHTKFWFTYMDDDGDGIPQYNHANDSGEDNGTVFEVGYPVEAPDLCSYLVLQCEFLSKTAEKLGKTSEAEQWQQKADGLMEFLIEDLWTGEQFVTKNVLTGKYNKKSRAFINYHPIILGKRLPKEIREKLIRDLTSKNSIVTEYGPASEHPDSPYFKEDGYWRGAVWPPQFYFLCMGMQKLGKEDFARKMARTYCEMCQRAGFPENFSALDGGGLKDSGYAWTVDVFFLLANEFLYDE